MDTLTRPLTKDKERDERGMRLIPPRLTGDQLRAKGRARVTLTTTELEQLARLLRAGRVLTNERHDVAKNLRTAMTRMGVDTRGV
jgi:hypothetical protein